MLKSDGDHFQPFEEVYGTETTEIYRPTFVHIPTEAKKARSCHEGAAIVPVSSSANSSDQPGSMRTLFTASKPKSGSKKNITECNYIDDSSLLADSEMYTSQNARATVECIECRKPRVIYAKQRFLVFSAPTRSGHVAVYE